MNKPPLPKNISNLLKGTDEALLQDPHDGPGTGPDHYGIPRRDVNKSNLLGTSSMPKDHHLVAPAQGAEEYDAVNRPRHYLMHPSGVECIEVTEWMNFNLGNEVKYIWRSDEKGATIEDLEKAQWYLAREIGRLKRLRDRR